MPHFEGARAQASTAMYFLPRAGPIPTSLVVSSIHAFTFLVHLTELSVPYNQLSGVIPSAIGNLANLLVVDMESNQLRQVNEQGHHTIIATPPLNSFIVLKVRPAR